MSFDKIISNILIAKGYNIQEFLEKRKQSAIEIAKKSKAKGGLSLLTATHFSAKNKPYVEAIRESTSLPLTHCKDKALKLLKQLEQIDSITQTEWQKLTGELEAYGEAYIISKRINE